MEVLVFVTLGIGVVTVQDYKMEDGHGNNFVTTKLSLY